VDPVRLVVWSDYLCPWCYNVAHRLEIMEREFGPSLRLEWRSFLLRPQPRTPSPGDARVLEKFVRYTQSWLRPAAEDDAPDFRVWESSEGPPSHSVPAHLAAKAAARLGEAAFAAFHQRLLQGYFQESRDISDAEVLRALWEEAGLEADGFDAAADPALRSETLEQFREAQERGITGVPAVAVAGHEGFVMGAQPLEVYRRWITRLREGVLD
jgi:predicted DsbA family dithiol-disulfide isomerase